MAKIRVTKIAEDDIRDLVENLKNINLKLAKRFITELNDQNARISLFPHSGTPVPLKKLKLKYRYFKVSGYLFFYIVKEEDDELIVEISRVFAERSNWIGLLR